MEEMVLAVTMTTLLVLAMVCAIIFKKLRMPAIIGYLATGIILANYIDNYNDEALDTIISLLSDIGLVLLMYTIGMELNLEKLRKGGAFSVFIVLVQVPIVLGAGILFGSLLGWDFVLSLCMGAVLSGSSTAVVLVVQREKKVMSSEDLDTMLLILVVEDIAQVILLSVLTPMIQTSTLNIVDAVILLAEIVIFMAVTVFVGIRVIPKFMDWVGDRMSEEVLLISGLGICFLLATIALSIGVSMAVGAFLAGVIMSKCVHLEKLSEKVTPMKDVFMAMFFISVGLEVDPGDLVDNILLVIGILLLFIISRTIAIFLGYFLADREPRLSFMSATSLLTMGEFAFIISSAAYAGHVMPASVYSAVIGAALVSMVIQSFITGAAGSIYDGFVGHLPQKVHNFNGWVLRIRADIHERFTKLSDQTTKEIKGSLTGLYFNAILVVVILAVFANLGSDMERMLSDFLPSVDEFIWDVLLDMVEFMLLLIPLIFALSRISKLNLMTIKDMMSHRADAGQEDYLRYLQRYAKTPYVLTAVIIDLVLMILFAGNLDTRQHIINAVIALVLFNALWYVIFRRRVRNS